MSELYTVIYHGINIYRYKINTEEKSIVEDFRQKLIDICNNLDVSREKCFDGNPYMGRLQDNYDFEVKYKEDIGYFVLTGERGVFSIMEGFPTKDEGEAKLILLKSEFQTGGFTYELNARDRLEKEWTKKYRVEYDSRKAAFEYTIEKLSVVFNYFSDSVIKEYTNNMNRWFNPAHWYYDKNRMSFEEV